MEIADARVASIHYTLTDDAGNVLDKSPESQPLMYFHGAGNIVPGLEKALAGKKVGDSLKVDVKPEEGYGQRNDALVQVVPRTAFQGVAKIEAGMQIRSNSERGPMRVPAVEPGDDQATIATTHHHAGRTLPLHSPGD